MIKKTSCHVVSRSAEKVVVVVGAREAKESYQVPFSEGGKEGCVRKTVQWEGGTRCGGPLPF